MEVCRGESRKLEALYLREKRDSRACMRSEAYQGPPLCMDVDQIMMTCGDRTELAEHR